MFELKDIKRSWIVSYKTICPKNGFSKVTIFWKVETWSFLWTTYSRSRVLNWNSWHDIINLLKTSIWQHGLTCINQLSFF